MIKQATLSGDVPVRGTSASSPTSIPVLITKDVQRDMDVDITVSKIQKWAFGYYSPLWYHVEIKWPDCAKYCERNLIPSWAGLPRAVSPKKFPPKVAGEKPTKQDAVRAYVEKTYQDIIPKHVSHKAIARAVGVSERTVRRALGRK
jgi:hypothetical protein